MDDNDLITRIVDGDPIASEALVRRHSDMVYRIIQRVFIHKQAAFVPDDVADMHNSVFLALFENECRRLRQYKGKNGCRLSTWIGLVTVRLTLNHLRKLGLDALAWRWRLGSLKDEPEFESGAMLAWDAMEKCQQCDLIAKLIEDLPRREQLVIRLHFSQDFSIPEIAQTMDIAAQTVHTIKYRALKRIRAYVDERQKNGDPV